MRFHLQDFGVGGITEATQRLVFAYSFVTFIRHRRACSIHYCRHFRGDSIWYHTFGHTVVEATINCKVRFAVFLKTCCVCVDGFFYFPF